VEALISSWLERLRGQPAAEHCVVAAQMVATEAVAALMFVPLVMLALEAGQNPDARKSGNPWARYSSARPLSQQSMNSRS